MNRDLKISAIVDNREELFRSKRILTKEPDTIAWIDSLFLPNEVFFDVGANIGAFSLYAGKRVSGLRVFAFEPHCQNFAKLNENININGLNTNVVAYPIALDRRNSIATLGLSNINAGFSGHQYNSDFDQRGFEFKPAFKQGCVGFTMDSLVFDYNLPNPNHIKIDVDGNELSVIQGAQKILSGKLLRSILIEINLGGGIDSRREEESKQIIGILTSDYGFRILKVSRAGSDPYSHNYVFSR
jgi:FkbM family methyltransferase